MTPSLPFSQDFLWQIAPEDSLPVIQFQRSGYEEPSPFPWLTLGSVNDLLEPLRSDSSPLSWRIPYSKHDSEDRKAFIRRENDRRANQLLFSIGEACGRSFAPPLWRMLEINPVIHFQFGPAVTVCTDGSRVVLFSAPRYGCEWALVHRTNVMGPVCGTPVAPADWNWLENKPFVRFGQRAEGTKSSKPKPTTVEKAMEMLRKLLAKS